MKRLGALARRAQIYDRLLAHTQRALVKGVDQAHLAGVIGGDSGGDSQLAKPAAADPAFTFLHPDFVLVEFFQSVLLVFEMPAGAHPELLMMIGMFGHGCRDMKDSL